MKLIREVVGWINANKTYAVGAGFVAYGTLGMLLDQQDPEESRAYIAMGLVALGLRQEAAVVAKRERKKSERVK